VIIALVGLSAVGKTSLAKKVFSSIPPDEAFDTKPTIYKEETKNEPKWIEEPVVVADLGGQERFLSKHLEHHDFAQSHLLVFVLNLQEIERIDKCEEYFAKVIAKTQHSGFQADIAVFFHKYDPDKRKSLDPNIGIYFQMTERVFKEVKYRIFLTSIKDNSCFLAFHYLLLHRSQETVFRLGLATLDLSNFDVSVETSEDRILEKIALFGREHSIKTRSKWLEFIVNKKELSFDPSPMIFQLEKNEGVWKLVVDQDSIPSINNLEKSKVLEAFIQPFSTPLYFRVEGIVVKDNLEVYLTTIE